MLLNSGAALVNTDTPRQKGKAKRSKDRVTGRNSGTAGGEYLFRLKLPLNVARRAATFNGSYY
jgi:hypothetical protein